jgi:hypothetical protein
MATLHFDGVGDYVRGTGNGALNGAFTYAALVQRDAVVVAWHGLISASSATAWTYEFGISNTTDLLFADINPSNARTAPTATIVETSNDWWIAAMTKAAGTTTPRFHLRNVTTGAAWIHENGGGTQANPSSASGGNILLGNFSGTTGNPGSLDDDFNGDMALAGWWDGTALSDGQINELDVNHRTSDWYNNSAGLPSSLTELNTLTPTDLRGLMAWTVSVSGLTGGDPTSWTFDAQGAADNQTIQSVGGHFDPSLVGMEEY